MKMTFIKEESEDMKIEEAFGVKHEDIEEQTDPVPLKEEKQELKEEHEDFDHILCYLDPRLTETPESERLN
ncbi:hypothetical protein QQF64_035905 [Cirrhinus molitorella]|uniref:Uncharacterized protein n=1 Tax=Cirrhinus molitorella TaxID=172907 RepID=A0ABR3NHP9_9TELE